MSVVAARTGLVHRPNHPVYTSTLSNWGKISGSPRCSEPATLSAARVVLACRKARTRLPERSSTRGAGAAGVRSAVGEWRASSNADMQLPALEPGVVPCSCNAGEHTERLAEPGSRNATRRRVGSGLAVRPVTSYQ